MLKRKILIKNKRLKPSVEKRQLELLKSGINVINETNEDLNTVEGEEIDDVNKTNQRPLVEEAHPELSAEEQKKATYKLMIKKVNSLCNHFVCIELNNNLFKYSI
jgi:predicted transcriptional regulator